MKIKGENEDCTQETGKKWKVRCIKNANNMKRDLKKKKGDWFEV